MQRYAFPGLPGVQELNRISHPGVPGKTPVSTIPRRVTAMRGSQLAFHNHV